MCTEFGRNLEKDVVSDTSGHFRRLLVSVCTGGRDQSTHVDTALAEKDANGIYAVLIQSLCLLRDGFYDNSTYIDTFICQQRSDWPLTCCNST